MLYFILCHFNFSLFPGPPYTSDSGTKVFYQSSLSQEIFRLQMAGHVVRVDCTHAVTVRLVLFDGVSVESYLRSNSDPPSIQIFWGREYRFFAVSLSIFLLKLVFHGDNRRVLPYAVFDKPHFSSIVTGRPTTGSTIAWALTCQSDQFGRPTFGSDSFCCYLIFSTSLLEA